MSAESADRITPPASTPANANAERVLLLAPTPKDGRITQTLLAGEGLTCVLFDTLDDLISEARTGLAGAVLLTEEVIASEEVSNLLAVLGAQPAWSDLPVVVLLRGTSQGGPSPVIARVLAAMTNVTLLERPAPMRSVASAVQAAVRARRRQYELRNMLEREQAARAELERAARMKDEFLATLSHELRTPLNAILGWSQLMRQGESDQDTIAEGLGIIERNARVQVQLIEDLLDMSRIISGKVRLNVALIEPRTVVEEAIASCLPAADAKGILLERYFTSDGGPLLGDAARLQQVVWNLLSNAIKFTPKNGRIDVRVSQHDESFVEIRVTDTGAGIRRDFLPHVFERFRQADASTTRAYGGLGLGLAIVKSLVELHGGTIHVESEGLGRGSAFSVRLPVASPRAAPVGIVRGPGAAAEKSGAESKAEPAGQVPPAVRLNCDDAVLAGVRVLVVDDEPDARHLVERILRACQAEVLSAGSAKEAFDLIAAATPTPDVMVSDIGMPDVDGYELLRRVRAWESVSRDSPTRGRRIHAIALTAFARHEDRTRAMLAGYAVHLSKPVEPQQLVATIASAVGR